MTKSQFSRFALIVLVTATLGQSRYAIADGVAATLDSEQHASRENAAPAPDFLSSPRVSRCAVRDPNGEQQSIIEAAAKNARDNGAPADIPVYWHIITTSSGGGDVTNLVEAQMDVLNNAFAGSGFRFEVQNIHAVANDAWFFAAAGSPEEIAMKAALRQGGPEALNVYTTNGDVYLGWATLPFYYKFSPGYDGVVLWWAALPGTGLGGPAEDEPDGFLTYDLGDTGTHEVGHWLGLDHTFAGGRCTQPGDYIKDTPTEAEPQFYCKERDSCLGPAFPGGDPFENFMDHTDDVCMNHFTAEQTKRMRKHFHAFRDKGSRE